MLEEIAFHLNAIPKMKGMAAAWRKVEEIVALVSPPPEAKAKVWDVTARAAHGPLSKATKVFNEWSSDLPVWLMVHRDVDKKGNTVKVHPLVHHGTSDEKVAAWFLWEGIFRHEGWLRIKRCPQCNQWFVDDTKNRSMVRCSPSCSRKWWTVDRRRAARHKPWG